MDGQPSVDAVIEQIAPRLRRAREKKGVSLAGLAGATGISTSTLSRLESAQRKPSLELLLPITAALGIPLDEIVASPRIADSVRPRRAAARAPPRLKPPGLPFVRLGPRRLPAAGGAARGRRRSAHDAVLGG
ncbi:helix-turn-helix domain-containing protein, partial [Nocardia cyriacigeorgica]|uniref:helix-turn-helix domain-containing protein n=1 Tax=Nocardia cyriacigeorgica TaxID=135487 RepID=UPI0024549571